MSDDFEITLPVERREEYRVDPAHTASQWKFKLRAFNHRCAYCGVHQRATKEQHLFRDHVKPISRLGTDHIDNIVPACWVCNGRKDSSLPGELSSYGRIVPQPKVHTRRSRYKGWP